MANIKVGFDLCILPKATLQIEYFRLQLDVTTDHAFLCPSPTLGRHSGYVSPISAGTLLCRRQAL